MTSTSSGSWMRSRRRPINCLSASNHFIQFISNFAIIFMTKVTTLYTLSLGSSCTCSPMSLVLYHLGAWRSSRPVRNDLPWPPSTSRPWNQCCMMLTISLAVAVSSPLAPPLAASTLAPVRRKRPHLALQKRNILSNNCDPIAWA